MKKIHILGIDTSCDDTSVAVLENDRVLVNVISSQIDVHREWGGVVPNLARREHEKMIKVCVDLALKKSGLKNMSEVDAIAVTYGPGLAPALEVGVAYAKNLAIYHDLPLIAVNHMEGHLLSPLLKNKNGKSYSGIKKIKTPFLALCVSGGHTEITWVEEIGKYKILGKTLDDAAGEAFDKVARMLDLGYPGGPVIAKLAEDGKKDAYELPRPMSKSKDYNFSFSGLKTACLYNTNELKKKLGKNFAKIIPDYCASLQEAIVDSLLIKTLRAIKDKKPKMLFLGGGVAANKRLRSRLRVESKNLGVPAYFSSIAFTMDNAAMIALAGYFKYQRGEFVKDKARLSREPSVTLSL
jgi:N6-L-threonylcarbamoyladenine synthase